MNEKKSPLSLLDEKKPWYEAGLRFSCTGCGKCCTGSPGFVWVTEEEIKQIADYLCLSIETFVSRYIRKIEDRFSLKEEAKTFSCVFLKEKKCLIYPVRPKQCQTFPWWVQNLKSKEAWEEASLYCEGIHQDAQLFKKEEIEKNKHDF